MLLSAQVIPQRDAFLSSRTLVHRSAFQWNFVQVWCPVWLCHQGHSAVSEMGDACRK